MKSSSPAENFMAVTPHDTNVLKNKAGEAITTRGIIVTAAGTVICRNAEGDPITVQCAAGIVIPIVTDLIKTGGTATGIVALW